MAGHWWATRRVSLTRCFPVDCSLASRARWSWRRPSATAARQAFQNYERGVIHHLKTWHEIVSYFYNGRMFTSFRVGQIMRKNLLIRLSFPHINKHMGRIFTGAAGKSPYSMAMMRFLMKHGLKNEDPQEMAIR